MHDSNTFFFELENINFFNIKLYLLVPCFTLPAIAESDTIPLNRGQIFTPLERPLLRNFIMQHGNLSDTAWVRTFDNNTYIYT